MKQISMLNVTRPVKYSFLLLISTILFLTSFILNAADFKADGIAAVVGSDIILISEVDAKAKMLIEQMSQMKQPEVSFKKIRKMALQSIINDKLVAQQAKDMELKVTDDEVESAINNMAAQNHMDKDAFKAAIESQGMTMAEYHKSMKKDLLKYKVMNLRVRGRVNISEQQARTYYNNQVKDVREGAWYQGAHILIRVPAGARAIEVANLRKKALNLMAKIKNGISFEEVAKNESEDSTTAPFGGHLGKRMPGDIPRILNQAFLNMEPGEISGPVRTSAGFHILKMASREDTGVKPFKEVQKNIIGQLTQKEMERQQKIWLNELRRKIFISIRI